MSVCVHLQQGWHSRWSTSAQAEPQPCAHTPLQVPSTVSQVSCILFPVSVALQPTVWLKADGAWKHDSSHTASSACSALVTLRVTWCLKVTQHGIHSLALLKACCGRTWQQRAPTLPGCLLCFLSTLLFPGLLLQGLFGHRELKEHDRLILCPRGMFLTFIALSFLELCSVLPPPRPSFSLSPSNLGAPDGELTAILTGPCLPLSLQCCQPRSCPLISLHSRAACAWSPPFSFFF